MEEKSKQKQKDKDNGVAKLERLISVHSLEGIVFEKRERKQSVPVYFQPLPNSKPTPSRNVKAEKPKEKKVVKREKEQQKAKAKKAEEKPSLPVKKISVQKSESTEKKRGRPPKPQGPLKRNPKERTGLKKENKIQELQQKKQGRREEPIPEESQGDDNQISQKQMDPQLQQLIHSQKVMKSQKQIQERERADILSEKVPFQSRNEHKQSNSNQLQSQKNSSSEKNSQSQPQIQREPIKKNSSLLQHEQGGQVGNKRKLRAKAKFNEVFSVKEEDEEQIQSSSNNNRRRQRLRKTKDEALKKFTMIEAGASDEDENDNYQIKKKKGQQKQYHINRIFRKTQKLNLPGVKLQINAIDFHFENFAEKSKEFDMIHCSLPLEMLLKLPNISSLICRGFIFIWVEKGQIQMGYHWLNRIGFDVIDQIIWIKTNETMNEVVYNEEEKKELFPNCKNTCLVGYKCSSNQKSEYYTKISNNIIFSPDRPGSFSKPDQIFQIGDLMMPGAKKLEIGEKQLGGWFTLKHIEASLTRCHKCLKRQGVKLHLTESKEVICNYCTLHQEHSIQLTQNNQQNQRRTFSKTKSKLYQIKVQQKNYRQGFYLSCSTCLKKYEQYFIQGIRSQEDKGVGVGGKQVKYYCKYCYELPEEKTEVCISKTQRVYFPKKPINCSVCSKSLLCSYYLQCFTCKNDHNICSTCLTTISTSVSKQDEKGGHEWKLKILNQTPAQRVLCFQCHQQCSIPYWGCQTCEGWFWCGKCKNKQISQNHKNHSHYNRKHYLDLIF